MRTALVLMTALVPTTGHADLIAFASGLDVDRVAVLLSGRSTEPVDINTRKNAIRDYFAYNPRIIDLQVMMDDQAPQNPPDHPDFWGWWKRAIESAFPHYTGHITYVVASEPYGQQVADSLPGAQFMPYDIERSMNPVRGTDVRQDLWGHWNQILPAARRSFMLNATLFGQESVGKTTLARAVTEQLSTEFTAEWARPYLETVGSDLDENKMRNICVGQAAVQKATRRNAKFPVAVLDTDLFSTIGYYAICGMPQPASLESDARLLASDVYYVMPDDIPFCPDPLRYGGGVRETDTQFWVDLLERFGLPYVRVPSGSVAEKTDFLAADIVARFNSKNASVRSFLRE